MGEAAAAAAVAAVVAAAPAWYPMSLILYLVKYG